MEERLRNIRNVDLDDGASERTGCVLEYGAVVQILIT